MNTTKRTIAGIAVLAVLVGAAIPALAQGPTATGREERATELAAALAEELGLDTETVAAALLTVRTELAEQRRAERRTALEERLADAVAAGSLTQEQADSILAAADAGVLPRKIGHGHGHGHGHVFRPPPDDGQDQ